MYKLLAVLFFINLCYSESEGCEWWNQRHQNAQSVVVVVQPQPILVPVYQYPAVVYQPVVVQETRLVPVVENRVIYYPINSYYLSNQYRY